MLSCLINGVSYEMTNEFEISEQVGNKTATTINVLVDNQAIPKSGDVVEIIDTETNDSVFWGVCGIPTSPKYETGLEANIYNIVCNNANAILANRLCNVAYQNNTVTQIVTKLFNQYIAEEGITLGTISNSDIILEVYTAANYNLQDALDELADLINATWQITPDRVFNFVLVEDFPMFPYTFNTDFILGTELESKMTDYKSRTVQYIAGATDITQTQTEEFTYSNTEQENFTVSFGIALAPAIYVNNEQVPSNIIGVSGITSNDPSIVFSWTYNSNVIYYNSNSEYLSIGDTVKIVYQGVFNIRVVAQNAEKIAEIAAKTGTSGKRENVYVSQTTSTTADALQLANSLLTQFEESTTEVSFWLLASQLYALGLTLDDLSLLKQISFDLPAFGLTGNFVITERVLEPFWGNMSPSNEKYKISLLLKNRDYLKSYAETISDLKKDIDALTIRGDEIVISGQSTIELFALSESYMYDYTTVWYPTLTNDYGGIAAPLNIGEFFPL